MKRCARFATHVAVAFCVGLCLPTAVFAAPGETPPDAAPPAQQDVPKDGQEASKDGLQFQEFDEPVTKLKPLRPRTVAEESRLDALAWFAAGRLLQDRGDMPGALRAYHKAIDSDPTAVAVYRDAIRLAVELKQFDVAIPWAKRAVELDPGNVQLLMQAITLLMNRDDVPGAIQLLELAVKVPGIDHHSPQYVLLMRDLSILYSAVGRKEDAAKGFEVLFDALTNPEKYKLDARLRTELQRNPAVSFERMGQTFLEVNKTDLALAAFLKASEAADAKKGPAAANLSFNLAQVYLQANQPDKGLEEIQKYIDSQRRSKGRAAYELLASLLQKAGKPQELLPRLEAAARQDTRNSTLQYFLAEQYTLADRLDDAEGLFRKTLDWAAEPQGYIGLAGVYRRKGRPAELLDALGKGYLEAGELKEMAEEMKAIVGDEKLLSGLLETGLKRLDAMPPTLEFSTGYVLANLAADGKRSEEAEKLYRFLLTLRKEKAQLIYEELGSHLVEVRKYPAAAKVYQEAVDSPDLTDARANFLFMLTYAMELSGETGKALEAIAAAQQLIPNNPLLLSQEAWVYYHSHQYPEAIQRFEKLIADFPQPQVRSIIRRAQYSLSNIHVLQGDVQKGLKILEAIYKENPTDISVNNDLGYLYADNNMHLEQAEAMIRKALAAEPENAAYLDSMGWVLFKLGRVEEAIPYLEKAVKISTGTGDETLYDHLGDAYDRAGQSAKATEAWKKSLDMAKQAAFPDQKLIDRVAEKLKNRAQDPGKLKTSKPGSP